MQQTRKQELQELSAVEVGEVVRVKGLEPMTVQASCGSSRGFWFCTTHPDDEGMATHKTQLQKDIHIHHGKHRLGWMCWEHGLEKP